MDYLTGEDDSNSAIPRNRVFVLLDGSFVVRWAENRVQELESGQYRLYDKRDFGAPITDYELKQLQDAGLVENFDRDTVWLCALPEQRKPYNEHTSWQQERIRYYYLNTTLPGRFLQDVIDLLEDLGLADHFQPRVRDDFVVLWAQQGTAFHKFDDVEKARTLLASRSPEAFENTVVAFIETNRH